MMKAQTPAKGIMLQGDWPDAKSFHIPCECTDPDHAADMWIEVDRELDLECVNVTFYVKTTNEFWREGYSRVRAAWDILTKGVHTQSHTMILDKQSALNMAEAIKTTIKGLS